MFQNQNQLKKLHYDIIQYQKDKLWADRISGKFSTAIYSVHKQICIPLQKP